MNHAAYSEFVGALASKERHTHLVPRRLFDHVANQALYDQPFLDGLKKALFAGKFNPMLESIRRAYVMPPGGPGLCRHRHGSPPRDPWAADRG